MNILLLGGSGYIGSKFYQTYKNKYNITSIDLNLFQTTDYSKELNFANVPIDRYDVIICLAGHSSVNMCEYSPQRSWVNNVDNFRKLCDNVSNQKLIYASSASVYGSGSSISSEDSPVCFTPINHYDLQKITIDLIANRYIKDGKNLIGLRFGTVNGASPNTRQELMLNSMVRNAIDTRQVNAKNMNIRRAILGINDLIRALEKIIENDILAGQYNLSSFNSNVSTLAHTVSRVCNAELVIHPPDAVSYDFEMNTRKFEQVANFVFTDTVESLVEELKANHKFTNYSTRDNDGEFSRFM
jgi:nucleoside-diphosphate-sugar epimerase